MRFSNEEASRRFFEVLNKRVEELYEQKKMTEHEAAANGYSKEMIETYNEEIRKIIKEKVYNDMMESLVRPSRQSYWQRLKSAFLQ